ncbi:MAG: DUF4160 domain-containing protein [Clostridia bacterium]|nr:DUF4160 domain-containing protein [Clostridia bacterium]MBQ9041083.1 DUF4160 domain-containing protein [Clostridia bacterium]
MPQLFRVGSYVVYFWINESHPLEPVHVHIAEVRPSPNGTKLWITRAGKCLLANNNSHIPERALRILIAIIEARREDVVSKWLETFGEVRFYC